MLSFTTKPDYSNILLLLCTSYRRSSSLSQSCCCIWSQGSDGNANLVVGTVTACCDACKSCHACFVCFSNSSTLSSGSLLPPACDHSLEFWLANSANAFAPRSLDGRITYCRNVLINWQCGLHHAQTPHRTHTFHMLQSIDDELASPIHPTRQMLQGSWPQYVTSTSTCQRSISP